jgi:nucleoside 2-deoxyribosyltransferase
VPDDQNPKVFFISPIGEGETETRKKADQTVRHLVRKALEPEPLNCEVERADEDTDPGSITPRMLNSITTADLVVIDLTDHNPNVFYEMAIAHGYRKPCVHIITDGQKVPFDVKDMNTVPYTLTDPDKLDSAVTRLRMYAETALKNGTTSTPLSAAERFNVVQSSTDPTVEALAEIVTRLDDLNAVVQERSRFPRIRFAQGNTVVFTREYVEHTSVSTKTYAPGISALVAHVHTGPSGGITHVDIRLPDGKLVRRVPVDYFLD